MLNTPELTATSTAAPSIDLERLVGVRVDVTVELGRTKMTLGEALEIGPGAVIPLDRTAGAPLALKVNGQLVARGEVLVIDDVYGLQITEVIEAEAPIVAQATPALLGQVAPSDGPDGLVTAPQDQLAA